ncbi:MAG TPA: glycosyltransferase [Bacteroidales bacterium]|nr:glycosyltransferase [Bacteroidales bacterium]
MDFCAENVTFITAINDESVLKKNLLSSPLFSRIKVKNLIMQKDYISASQAYNAAIRRAETEFLIFVHQDIVLPQNWINDVNKAISILEDKKDNWGIIGCFGVDNIGIEHGYLFCTGNGRFILEPFDYPQKVKTLDEIVLILKKSSKLTFDEFLPHFHFYGTDICLQAAEKGMSCYAISAFCLHNSNQTTLFPSEFFAASDYIRKKWSKYLPIHTPCVSIGQSKAIFNIKYKFYRSLNYSIRKTFNKIDAPRKRVENVDLFLNRLLKK